MTTGFCECQKKGVTRPLASSLFFPLFVLFDVDAFLSTLLSIELGRVSLLN